MILLHNDFFYFSYFRQIFLTTPMIAGGKAETPSPWNKLQLTRITTIRSTQNPESFFLEGLHNYYYYFITNVIYNVATCNITAAFTVYTWPPAHHCLPWQHCHSLTLTHPLPSLLLAISLQLKHQVVPHIIKASLSKLCNSLASYSRLLVIRIMKYFQFYSSIFFQDIKCLISRYSSI